MDQQADQFSKMRRGLASAFEANGHPCYLYDLTSKAPLDAFYDLRPDLYIGTYNLHTMAVRKGLEKYGCRFFALEAIKPAFDSVNLKAGRKVSSLECDVAYIGNPKEDLVTILKENNYKFKLFGPKSWGIPQYLGNPTLDETIANIYSSTIFSPAFSLEDFYTIVGCGGFPVQLIDLALYSDNYDKEAIDKTKSELYEMVLNNCTYFHRVNWIIGKLYVH